jgi:hypothetical protein
MPDFFRVWQREFEEHRVKESEADAASVEMAQEAPRFPNSHLNTLMGKIRSARRMAATAGVHGHYDDIEVARAGCRECPTCSGNGMVSVPGPDAGKPKDQMPRTPRLSVAAYCGCGLGSLMKRLHLEKEPRLATRIRQAPPPASDDDAIEAHWRAQRESDRRQWVADALAAYPNLRRVNPVFAEAKARLGCYRAEVEHLHPWPGSAVYPEPAAAF